MQCRIAHEKLPDGVTVVGQRSSVCGDDLEENMRCIALRVVIGGGEGVEAVFYRIELVPGR